MIIPFHLYERKIQNIIAYHGTNNEFDEFDYMYVGYGLDEYGPGFYFTNSYEIAEEFGKVGKYELTINKYIKQGQKSSKSDISKLIRWAPEYEDILTNYDENAYESLNKVIEILSNYDKIDCFLTIWQDFYKKRGNSRKT